MSMKTMGTIVATAAVTVVLERWWRGRKEKKVRETRDHEAAKAKVWSAIGGALSAAHMYLGDQLGLYAALKGGETTTVEALAEKTGLKARFLREWVAQQAACGVLELSATSEAENLKFRLPCAFFDVLADPESEHYDVSLIEMVPCLVERARTVLPEAFKTGVSVGYNDPSISSAIDRAHVKHVRRVVLPKVFPATRIAFGRLKMPGARVAELGCGGGNFMLHLAAKFPSATFHGYEISEEAIELCRKRIYDSRLSNVFIHDARIEPLGDAAQTFDLVTTYDVLHDATQPDALVQQVARALKPDGAWLLGDIACLESPLQNVKLHPGAVALYGFSTCLCLSSSLSEPNGRGLGTMGWTIPVAMASLHAASFKRVDVVAEIDNMRWFEATF